MTQEAIEAALLRENAVRCRPPLPDGEVRAIASSIAGYTPGGGDDAANSAAQEIARIAALPDIQYERERTARAKELGVRPSALDNLIKQVREQNAKSKSLVELFGAIEPWGQPVDGEALLDERVHVFGRFIVLPKYAAETLALWTLFTYTHDSFQHSPILLLRSATKRCGKSTAVDLLVELVHRPMPASNVTPAVIFRVVEQYHPTLLIDELDSFIDASDEIRGILNSGHQRRTAMVYRIEEIRGKREPVALAPGHRSCWRSLVGRPRPFSIAACRSRCSANFAATRLRSVDMPSLMLKVCGVGACGGHATTKWR